MSGTRPPNTSPCKPPLNTKLTKPSRSRFALGGRPFSTAIFIGAIPDENPFSWTENTGTLVGEVYNFVSEPTTTDGETTQQGCDNCAAQQANHAHATGRVVLTNALITRFKQAVPHAGGHGGVDAPAVLASMAPRDVVAFLSRHLHWRVTADGATVPFEQIPSVKVSLAVGKADHFADSGKLSKFYAYKGAFQVTEGRPGGASRADGLYPPEAEWVDE
jgi:tyrosinase